MKTLNLFILTAILATAAFADIRLPDKSTPKPSPTRTTGVTARARIILSKNENTARLQLPKRLIDELNAANGAQTQNPHSALDFSRAQTIVGGLFLSLALVFGGVILARSKNRISKTARVAASGALLFLSGIFAVGAFANVGPPAVTRSITSRLFDADAMRSKQAYGDVKIEVIDTDEIYLIVPDVGEYK